MSILFEPKMLLVLCGSLALYWCAFKTSLKRDMLLSAVSLGILFQLHPVFTIVMLLLCVSVYLGTRASTIPLRRSLAFMCLALSVLLLGKYGGGLIEAIQVKGDWVSRFVVAPLGISYFALRIIQYVFDHQRGIVQNRSFVSALTFFTFFPLIPAGPIETFQRFFEKRSASFDSELFAGGIRRVLLGYFKKLVLAELIIDTVFGGFSSSFVNAAAIPEQASISYVGFAILMFLGAYVDLSAYTDIALGLSALFGFKVMENFDRPLLAPNLAEFWRRWHISLSQWCRNNVYFPVFGITRKPALGLYASMIVMGLWHQLDGRWLLWGMYHATGLVTLLYWQKWKKRHPLIKTAFASSWMRPLGILATVLFVSFGFTLVAVPDAERGLEVMTSCYQSLAHLIMGLS